MSDSPPGLLASGLRQFGACEGLRSAVGSRDAGSRGLSWLVLDGSPDISPPTRCPLGVPLGDELIRDCWSLLAKGEPYRALDQAERALRTYEPPADSTLAGRLLLIVGVALAALGRREAANRYLADASWALENARDTADLRWCPRRAEGPGLH
jgi:hypothetical protein